MSGYTPVFDSVFQGTLCGRWPDTGVWLCLLALADKDGRIDSTIPYISAVTGIPADVLIDCIGRFTSPDPASRTKTDDGRRLVLIDPEREWGWVVVNHGKYREKARKQMQQIASTESGRDAERKRIERERKKMSGDVQSRPAMSSADRLSDSDSDSDTNKDKEAAAPPFVNGLDMSAWSRWETYRREIKKPIKPASILAAQRKLAGFGAIQAAAVENSIAEGYTGLFAPKDTQKKFTAERKVAV